MHDIDRTQLEMGWEAEPYSAEEYEYESDDEDEDEYEFEYESDDDDEDEDEYEFEYESPVYGGYQPEMELVGPFSEAEEMELAAELLGITDEAELDQFIGKFISRVGRRLKKRKGWLGRFARSRVGGIAGRFLKRRLKRATQIGPRVLGGIYGGPAGAKIGGAIGKKLWGELELEGLSPEDQEFEVAKRVVRMAGDAAKIAVMAPPSASPKALVKALNAATRKHVAGKVASRRPSRRRGVWERRGSSIILRGA